MNEISCDICKDLIPIVQDGIASNESAETVKKHIASCEKCARMFSGVQISDTSVNGFFDKFKKRLQIFCTLIMTIGIFIGISAGMEGTMEILLNVILMPIVGVLGFIVFRWKAIFYIPPVLIGVFLLLNAMFFDSAAYDFSMILLLSLIYSAIVLVGIVIAGLLHFAFRKDDKNE